MRFEDAEPIALKKPPVKDLVVAQSKPSKVEYRSVHVSQLSSSIPS